MALPPQEFEPFWCPWAQDLDFYEILVIGNGDALADWSNMHDVAQYVVVTLSKPSLSANTHLYFQSETLSQNAMVALLRKYAGGRDVRVRVFSSDDAHRFIARPEEASREIEANSNIRGFLLRCEGLAGFGYVSAVTLGVPLGSVSGGAENDL